MPTPVKAQTPKLDPATAKLVAEAAAEAVKEATKKPSIWDKLDVPIEHAGRTITLPAEPGQMPLERAVQALQRRIEDENQKFQMLEQFDAYPHDAAVAFVRAMQKLHGFASFETKPGLFWDTPPAMVSVRVGYKDHEIVQCPVGQMRLPGVDDAVTTMLHPRMGFILHGEIKKKDRHVTLELATETRRILREESIYRGRAIRLGVTEDGELDTNHPPGFMDVSDISESDVLFDLDIQAQIHNSLLVPIKHTQQCRDHAVPLKRGVLLEGPYGTGKSLTARMAASVCEANGWTFVLLDKVQGLKTALEFANRYAPAVVFAEDIDRIAEIRDEKANDLINTIDGVVSKGSEIMIVLTTNFVDKLNPVILRPGRLDDVITLRAPNAETVQKLTRYYARGLLKADEDLTQVGTELDGQIPASIRECVERAKLGMIGRGARFINADDLVVAARTMKNHLALLNRKVAEETVAEKLAGALQEVVMNGRGEKIEKTHKGVVKIAEDMGVDIT